MRKSFFILLSLLLLTSCAQQPKAPEDYIGIEAAKAAALADAALPPDTPADFSTAGLDQANGEDFYAVNFTAEGTSYQYEIHPVTGAVIRANSQGPRLIGDEAAQEIALQHAGLTADQVTVLPIEQDIENGRQVYDVEFYTADHKEYDYNIDAITGEVVSYDSDIERPLSTDNPPPETPNTGTDSPINEEVAKAVALKHAGLTADAVTFLPTELDWENGRQVYDIEFYTADRKEYDYDIDAATGEIISFDYDAEHALPQNTGSAPITADQARNIALAKVPGASSGDIWDFEADYDDGRLEYEIEIRYNGMEYDFEIDGTNGTILEMDSEPIS
ncbi:MAG: PepSY domain-containing protein [Oscillospiraceae bacterium]|jgi:uncharacterized membrane protein YkoI|nr:PepSY domain-containing protein [Oscillospiraceae bacterium]